MNRVKADFLRIFKEKLSLIPLVVIITMAIGVAQSMDMQDLDGALSYFFQGMISEFAMLILLLFISPANIFFGDDFNYRTINHALIKSKSRQSIFLYKWVMTLLFGVFYACFYGLTAAIGAQVTTGETFYQVAFNVILHQLPFYLLASSISIVCYLFFERTSVAVTVYILSILVSPQLLQLFVLQLFHSEALLLYIPDISRISRALENEPIVPIVALVYTVLFSLLAYWRFNSREFK